VKRDTPPPGGRSSRTVCQKKWCGPTTRAAVDEAKSLQSDHEYRGTDPVDAALVHARVERNLRLVLDGDPPSIYARESPLLAVAEWGEHAESARARVADATYLSDQFTSSLPDDAGTIEETLGAAAESVAADLRDRRAGLPPEPTENDYDLVDRLRYRLRDEAEESPERVAEAQGPASAVLAATEGLVEVGAFDRFQERVDDGESFGAAEAADVRETRTEALDAIRAALSGEPTTGTRPPGARRRGDDRRVGRRGPRPVQRRGGESGGSTTRCRSTPLRRCERGACRPPWNRSSMRWTRSSLVRTRLARQG